MLIKKHISPTIVLIEKHFSQAEIKKMEEDALAKKGKEMEISGFRKGNAPLWKVKELVGNSQEWNKLISLKLQDNIINAWIEENQDELGKITRIIDFKVKNQKENTDSLDVEIEIEYFPYLKEGETKKIDKGIKVKKAVIAKEIKSTPEELKNGLLALQKKRTVLKPAKDKLAKDRLAFIKIYPESGVGEGKEHQDIFSWGILQYGKEFDEKTMGLSAEEERVIELTDFEDENSKRLKEVIIKLYPDWKEGNVKVLIKAEKIFISEKPELNDEFAKSLGNFNTLKELEASMKEGIVLEKIYAEKDRRREALIEELIDKVVLEVPQTLIEESAKREKEYFRQNMTQRYGDKAEEVIKEQEKKENVNIDETFKERARKIIKLHKIIESLALEKKIAPSEEEINEEISKIVASYPSPEEANASLGDDAEGLRIRVAAALTYNKVLEFLEKENKIMEDLEEEIKRIEEKK